MWHEARKQERKIRGLMVDYKKRAERRREFYEKIKLDPTQFLRVYGRPVKVNLDPAVAMAAESPQSMMPWQGDEGNMIDRFDVRAHLDMLPQFKIVAPPTPSRSEEIEERRTNYERYRTLIENECAGVSEEQALQQIYIDEQFGAINRVNEEEKRKLADKKAAIGYTYEDSTPADEEENESDESSDTDVETADLDVTLDVDALNNEQKGLLNQCAQQFGMKDDDYISWLTRDKEEQEELRQAKLLEEEKAQFAGRKSRRERRAYKEKRLAGRKLSPPSYAARDSPKYEPYKRASSSSRSRSRSPEPVKTTVEFITSFGGESDEEGVMQGPALPPHLNISESKQRSASSCENQRDVKKRPDNKYKNQRGSRSRSPPRHRNRSGYSRSRSRERQTHRGRSNTESQSRSPQKPWRKRSRSRSRSQSRSSYSSRSRSESRSRSSGSYSRSSSYSRSRSRSNSRRRTRSRSSHSKSRSLSKSPPKQQSVKRYRRKSLSSGSSNSDSDTERRRERKPEPPKNVVVGATKPLGKSASATSQAKLTPQEKLKRRMQAALNRQYKADKKAEVERNSKMEQERMDREEELRTRVLEMRRRERERRHRELEEKGISSSDSDSSSRSSSRSPSPPARRERADPPYRRDRTNSSSRRERYSPPAKRERKSPPFRRDRSSPPGKRERSPVDYRSRHRRYRRSNSQTRSRSRSKSPNGRRLVNY